MARELSSNWKLLQARIQPANDTPSLKRKLSDDLEVPQTQKTSISKRQRSTKSALTGKQDSMGQAQSQVSRQAPSASLALWAEDNDVSPEALSEAYGLGIKDVSSLTAIPVKPNAGLNDSIDLGKYLAMDCEMVGVGESRLDSVLARVSIVDFHGQQIYDSFVKPQERVTDWRTAVSGVSQKDMATARKFKEVQGIVAKVIKGRILVGHDLHHDLTALELDHPKPLLRDTAQFPGFKKYGNGPKPALRVLAKEILGVKIQSGQHSSIEDARVTMLLFRRYKQGFDAENAARYGPAIAKGKKGKPATKKPKKKSPK